MRTLIIVGDGPSALMSARQLVQSYRSINTQRVNIEIVGLAPMEQFGEGLAYGELAWSDAFWATQGAGRLSFDPQNPNFIAQQLDVDPDTPVKRKTLGSLNREIGRNLFKEVEAINNINIRYRQAFVKSVDYHNEKFSLFNPKGERIVQNAHSLILATGDIKEPIPTQFTKHPKVIPSPYDREKLEGAIKASKGKILAFLGGRSSAFDGVLATLNDFTHDAQKIKEIHLISRSGWMPFSEMSDDKCQGFYQLKYLKEENIPFLQSAQDVLTLLYDELKAIYKKGYYVPSTLLEAFVEIFANSHKPFHYEQNYDEEFQHHQTFNYHHLIRMIDWHAISTQLLNTNPNEYHKLTKIAAPFVTYNLQNCVRVEVMHQFEKLYRSGKVRFIQKEFESVDFDDPNYGAFIYAKFGIASIQTQKRLNAPIKTLVKQGLLVDNTTGMGLEVSNASIHLYILGSAALQNSFGGIGLESYGLQAQSVVTTIVNNIQDETMKERDININRQITFPKDITVQKAKIKRNQLLEKIKPYHCNNLIIKAVTQNDGLEDFHTVVKKVYREESALKNIVIADNYDEVSLHFVGYYEERPVLCIRLVFHSSYGFPLENGTMLPPNYPKSSSVELSRLGIIKEFRGKKNYSFIRSFYSDKILLDLYKLGYEKILIYSGYSKGHMALYKMLGAKRLTEPFYVKECVVKTQKSIPNTIILDATIADMLKESGSI